MRYRKKPVVIEAIQYTGNNFEEILNAFGYLYAPEKDPNIYVPTLEGTMRCKIGDYLIRGVRGELYPCAKDIFEETYEEVE